MKDKEYYENLDKRTKEYKEWKDSQPSEEELEDAAENITKGLGDMVASVTKAVGIEPCEGCKKRKDSLNLLGHQAEYFFKKYKPNPFTENDIIQWEAFTNRDNQNLIIPADQKLIVRLLRDILNMSVKPCSTCSASVWKKYINMIDTVYERN